VTDKREIHEQNYFDPNCEAASLPADLAEASDFLILLDNGLDGNPLVAAVRKMSPRALAIVEARLKQRDVVRSTP
jgi:hypothetical protein